jgi:glucuronate isomerase
MPGQVNGMRRYFDEVIETAGLDNTAGFNDDTRAFAAIPSRHDVWRRVSCDWLAGLGVTSYLSRPVTPSPRHLVR